MLPRPLSTFIGRQPERRVLLASVREHPLTTVVGPPGVGKTRLAVEVARELANEYPDRCWFVDLAPVGAAELVAPTVLGAIGAPSHERDALADVARAISSEPTLLVIDNCEHVGTTVAALCVALLDRCTELRILATSRSELGVAGERVAAVRPFDTAPARGRSDAVELFYDRANARGAELGRDDATAEEVTRICVRLDGLPLAIELAAARARVLTLAVLDQLLVAPLDVLTPEPARSSLPQRSLRHPDAAAAQVPAHPPRRPAGAQAVQQGERRQRVRLGAGAGQGEGPVVGPAEFGPGLRGPAGAPVSTSRCGSAIRAGGGNGAPARCDQNASSPANQGWSARRAQARASATSSRTAPSSPCSQAYSARAATTGATHGSSSEDATSSAARRSVPAASGSPRRACTRPSGTRASTTRDPPATSSASPARAPRSAPAQSPWSSAWRAR